MTSKEEIIESYIAHMKSICTLRDDLLRDIISKTIEKDPGQLEAIERILYRTEKVDLTTLTYVESTKYRNDEDWPIIGNEINIYVEKDCLSIDELKKLIQCVREIEQNNTDRVIKIWMDTPEKTIEEMENVIDSAKPGFPHKMVIKSPNPSKEHQKN